MIQYVRNIKSDASEVMIEASFTSDTLVIRENKTDFTIINLNPDLTFKGIRFFSINNANIECITISCS